MKYVSKIIIKYFLDMRTLNLVLNLRKCYFLVREGIVFGQKVYKSYMEVYKAKVEVITKLPPPVFINGMRSFLGHSDFYLKFVKDFFQD